MKKIKNNKIIQQDHSKEMLIYTTPNGKVNVEVFLRDENIWLTQAKIAVLFGVDRSVITKHLQNIYEIMELDRKSTSAKIAQVQTEGSRRITRNVEFYNLDAIISIGYRVNSLQVVQFRIWATERLKEYIIKGFTMNDERLKNPEYLFGKDYFEEQLERIRNIRSSERRFYQKITDIYSQCSADYNPNQEITLQFFATIQNKLHWAITGQTTAEIIHSRINSSKRHMGLTNWENSPKGEIRKIDVSIAKNYLNEDELDGLNRIVSMYLDFAEMRAKKGVVMYMNDWVEKLDAFLRFNEKKILRDNGKISNEIAVALAEKEYEKYRKKQDRDYISDFDREVKKLLKSKSKKKKILSRCRTSTETLWIFFTQYKHWPIGLLIKLLT
ncbi:MAG: cell filamentation protein Fic [Candidatus Nealsonbacteria bacterium CG_4_8_14_3_um_filter_39_7]|nr:MAG: cell filamentation protein Fic [Candidatus Nealsonbacteria bacterium CG_4_8_14_3_um_filter_39_7]